MTSSTMEFHEEHTTFQRLMIHFNNPEAYVSLVSIAWQNTWSHKYFHKNSQSIVCLSEGQT